jgi:hypothetical protein
MAIIALSIFPVLGSAIEQAESVTDFTLTLEILSDFTRLEMRADFQWRFFESFILEPLASQFAMSVQE